MHLTIHRGTHEIGGSCVELETKNSRILIDFGLPLIDENKEQFDSRKIKGKSKEELIRKGILHKIKGLYKDQKPEFDAILISHAHQDHYGLLANVNPKIPIYMSQGTKELIEVSYLFNQSNCNLKNVKILESWKSFKVKGFKITPYLVDHSGFDAMAFLIEAENKRIFYTGDFRGHGRKNVLFETMVKEPVKGIDYLIMEGTMLSRSEEKYQTELEIEQGMVKILKTTKNLTFLACSSQNIDRLVSAYRACMKTDTILVLDPYTAYVLYKLKGISKNIMQYDWGKNIKIFFIPNRYTDKVLNEKKMFKFGTAKITKEEVFSLKHKMLVKDSFTMRSIFKNKRLLKDTKVIYSMWEGYLEDVKNFWETNKVKIIMLHASGHAYVEDLVKFAEAMNPKNIVPIHTMNPEDYKKYFKAKLIMLEDGERFEL